ncbi:hypothetical protein VM1G_01469 [Cytospora mali]|uniref:Uncharacterized protein n=1 Tax=Cytospora mali TaxID=578113 RepID=A0A194VQE4_CYTMA|nr:hypothetical protein VM1G_01469 [Valsa mali]
MIFPFCTSRRRAPKKGRDTDKQEPQQPHEQARAPLSWTPTPRGQAATERLLSGDANAAGDLKTIIAGAEQVSRQAPRLNLNVRATEKWLQGNPKAIEDLVKEQKQAEMRVKKAATSQQRLGFSLMRNTSLVGEPFENICRNWSGDSFTGVKDNGCRGHWQVHYCSGGEGCNAQNQAVKDSEGRAEDPVSEEEGEADEEEDEDDEDEEFPFNDHFPDEEHYQHALHTVTAFAVKQSQAKTVTIPARTATLSRKRGQNPLRKPSSAGSSEDAPSERWSTQVRTGSPGSLLKNHEEEAPIDNSVPQELGARRSIRLSMIAGPSSGPPVGPLPPSPPTSWPLRSSWPLPSTVKDTSCGVL